ncbi:MAG: tetratricopeptide repeat protein [Acetobacter sp.]|nr:tetratricopeptide repeat protein [Acetobacter sp.]
MIKPTEDSKKCLKEVEPDKKVEPDFESVKKIERYVFLGAPGKPEEINAIQELFGPWNSDPLKNVCFKDQHFTNLAGVYPGYSNSQDVINKKLIDESHYAIFVFRDTLGSKDEESQQFRTVSEWERVYNLCLERKMITAVPFFFKELNDYSVNDFKKKFEDGEYKVTFFQEYDSIDNLKQTVSRLLREWDDNVVVGLLDFVDSLKLNIKNALDKTRTGDFEKALCDWNKANELVWRLFILIKIATRSYKEVIQKLQEVTKPDVEKSYSDQFVAWAWFMTGLVEDQLGNSQQKALEAYDEVIKRFKDTENLSLKKIVFKALHNKEAIFIKSEQKEEAIKSCEQLVELFKDESDFFVRELVCLAWYNWGSILCQQEKYKKAIEIFDEFYKKFGKENRSSIRTLLYDVLHNIANCLGLLEKFDEAIDICDQIIKERLGVSGDEQTLSFIIERSKKIFYGEKVRRAYDDKLSFLVNKAFTKDDESSKEEALGLCEKVIREFKDVDIEKLSAREQEIAIKAFFKKGKVFEDLFASNGQEENRNEAFKAYGEAIEKFNNVKDKESSVVKVLACILWNKGRMLREMEKEDDALEVLDEVITRFGGKEDLGLEVWVVGAYVEKGIIFDNKHNYEKALECYNYVITYYEKTRQDQDQDQVRGYLKTAIENAVVVLRDNIKCDQSLVDLLERVGYIFEKKSNKDSVFVATVKLEEGLACRRLSKKEKTYDAHSKWVVKALDCYRSIIHEYKSSDVSLLQEIVKKAETEINGIKE